MTAHQPPRPQGTVAGRPDREHRFGRAFVALADPLVDGYDVVGLLDQLVAHSVALLAADAAAVLFADDHQHPRAVAASEDDAHTMELLAVDAGEGPSLECLRTATQVRTPDLHLARHRWPVFTAAVIRAGGYRSVHALPLRLRGRSIGALALFHRQPGPLPEADLALGQALADVATIGILSERAIRRGKVVNGQLQTALDSRVVIEQAKGIVAQRTSLPVDAAFALLRGHARRHNLRLAELARQVVNRELDPITLSATGPRSD